MVTAVQNSEITRQALACGVFVRQPPDETYVVVVMVVRPYQGARWYNPANGRFNRLDPFFGNLQDPQSLHKYGYVHGDPIQGMDPTGTSLHNHVGMAGLIVSISLGSFFPRFIGIAVLERFGILGKDLSFRQMAWRYAEDS